MSQFIPLQQAISMTTLYRQERENILAAPFKNQNILALSETFDRDVIDALLAKPGCAALRVYYGMSADLKVHAILVAVNSQNEDILPALPVSEIKRSGVPMVTGLDEDVVEEGRRCPEDCPPPSPLNDL